MKRIRDFRVVLGQSEVDLEQIDVVAETAFQTSSWHKVWETIEAHFDAHPDQARAAVLDMEFKAVVASFSSTDMQLYIDDNDGDTDAGERDTRPQRPLWDSVPMAKGEQTQYFANRNIDEYEWHLLDGAKHEVPFRLSYLERTAENNPNGIVARVHRLLLEWRDMVAPNGA